jgi:hypothetical protein
LERVAVAEVEAAYGILHYYQAYRFYPSPAAPETPAVQPKKVSITGDILTIEYSGVKMTFDTSNEKSRLMVDAIIDAIYEKE